MNDNGPGIGIHQQEKLLYGENIDENGLNKVGINNVNRRIKLNFGDQYGIAIDSEENQFTNIIMIVPIIEI